jgi:hypothetical protein
MSPEITVGDGILDLWDQELFIFITGGFGLLSGFGTVELARFCTATGWLGL